MEQNKLAVIYKANRFGLANIFNWSESRLNGPFPFSMGRYSVNEIRAMFLIVKIPGHSVAGTDG